MKDWMDAVLKYDEKADVLVLEPTSEDDRYPQEIPVEACDGETVTVLASKKNVPAIIVRVDGVLKAFHAVCPHMGGELTRANYYADKPVIACPWHGYQFCARSGDMVENPNEKIMASLRQKCDTFDPNQRQALKLREVPLEIKDGMVRVSERKKP